MGSTASLDHFLHRLPAACLQWEHRYAVQIQTKSGVFVQISDENVHHVREIMDEVFGAKNFVSEIGFRKTARTATSLLASESDILLWYAKEKTKAKFRPGLRPSHF